MKAYVILMNILLSKVAYLAILSPHRKLLINRIDSEQRHKDQDRILSGSDSLKMAGFAVAGFTLGFVFISSLLQNFGGINHKQQILDHLEKKGGKLKTRKLVLRTYSAISNVLDKAKVRKHSIERILKNKKIWKKFLSNKQLMKKAMRIGNIGYVNLMNQPLRIQRKLIKSLKSSTIPRQLFSRRLEEKDDAVFGSCGEYFCASLFMGMFALGAITGFIVKWNEQSAIDTKINTKLGINSGDSGEKGRKLGVLSDLVKQIGSFAALNSSKSKKSSGSNFIQNLGVKFLTGQSNRKQKKIANIFSNIFSILPKNIKNMLKAGTFS